MAFIDIEKAFDMVPWEPLFKQLRRVGIDERLVRAIEGFYATEGETRF